MLNKKLLNCFYMYTKRNSIKKNRKYLSQVIYSYIKKLISLSSLELFTIIADPFTIPSNQKKPKEKWNKSKVRLKTGTYRW